MSQAAYPGALPPARIAERLGAAAGTAHHVFWADDASLLSTDCLRWASILGSRQITDAYLLLLAVRNGGRFVNFDRAVPLAAVDGATTDHLVVL